MSFKWEKLGRVFDPSKVGYNYIQQFAQAPSAIIFDNFVRVYFSCRPKPDENGQYVSYSAFVDLDKNNLLKILRFSEKPILKLGSLGEFDEFGTYPVSVIKRDNEFWAYYAGWTRCESVPYNTSIGLAISNDDGVTFEKYKLGPVLSFSLHEPMTISGPKIRYFNNKFYLFYVTGLKWIKGIDKPESVFKIRMAISNDGIEWQRFNKNIIEDVLEENECQSSPDVFFKNGKYHMFFSYKFSYDFRNRERGYRIGYAWSYDLLTWNREDSRAGLDVSEFGWDSEMVSYPHILELNNKIYMFYIGNSVGKEGFGVALLTNELM
jgi:sucrose-6-phosphate hydrolase SacC (GH32 family)